MELATKLVQQCDVTLNPAEADTTEQTDVGHEKEVDET
jgi:hypothetical protein